MYSLSLSSGHRHSGSPLSCWDYSRVIFVDEQPARTEAECVLTKPPAFTHTQQDGVLVPVSVIYQNKTQTPAHLGETCRPDTLFSSVFVVCTLL